MLTQALLISAVVVFASAKVFFHEPFDTDSKWEASTAKSDYGKMVLSSGAFNGDAAINQGYKTSQDARFYASSAALPVEVTNDNAELVVSLSVKHEQGLDCGGGYIKLLTDTSAEAFNGDSEYYLMFGPDQCGYNRRVHVIFNYNGKNLLWKKELRYPDDKLTHVYTLRVTPDNSYEVFIDQELKESGKLEDDWEFLEPKKIDDPSDKKPSDWVDEASMDDPDDKKPEDWDNEPETIADAEATKPSDWDEDEDGEWEAPQVPNPKYKGPWSAKRIPNPAYKGTWKPRQIDNPKYSPDDKLYQIRKAVKRVGIDVWQVKSGSIFDNIVIADNLAEVNAIVDATWKATKDAELEASKAAETAKNDDSAKPESDEDAKEEL